MGFTESQVNQRLETSIADILKFNREDLLVFKGSTSDTGRLYNELAAAFVYDHIDKFKAIDKHYRKDSYKTNEYKKYSKNQSNLNTEKQLNLALYRQAEFSVGNIIDAQMPLFKDFHHKCLGKVGNLLYTPENELFLLNAKIASTEQTLLRYIVEGMIARRLIDKKKLLRDFALPSDTTIKFAPLIFKGSSPHRELSQSRPNLYHLMAVLDLSIFVIENNYRPYKIKRYSYNDYSELLNAPLRVESESAEGED